MLTGFAKYIVCSLFLLLLVPGASSGMKAQDSAVRAARVAAATSSAAESLRDELAEARISPTLTVAQFLEATGGQAHFDRLLSQAQQIGGPRWVDDQTCQVRLELDGQAVSSALVQIALDTPQKSPLPAQVLAGRLTDWKNRSFSVTGMSTTFERATLARPPAGRRAWSDVSDEARANAIALAKLDAASQLLQGVREVQLGPGLTVGDALRNKEVRSRMAEWLASRPITRVDYQPDLQVEVRVAASAAEAFDALVDALRASPDLNLPLDDLGLAGALAAFEQQFRDIAPIGRATAGTEDTTRPSGAEAIVIPRQAPGWTRESLWADGLAGGASAGAARLRAQRSAQLNAVEELRAKIDALQLNDTLTVGEAARRNPRIADAVESALNRARVSKVVFRDDGSVFVRMTLDTRQLWIELDDAR
jgi:hypothetical protein